MKFTMFPLLAAPFLVLAVQGATFAADAGKPLASSQQRMDHCNKEAGDRRGNQRQDFMRQCMHGDSKPGAEPTTPATPAKPPKVTQEERKAHCDKEAGDKRGSARKAFMNECMKGK